MTDATSAAPSDAEIGDLCDQFRWDTAEGRRACARAVLAKWGAPQPVANQAPAPSFDDPRVQVVYSTICDDADWPPNGATQQHWEGWIARRIVERLDACKTVARVPQPVALVPLKLEEIYSIYLKSGLGKFHLSDGVMECEYERCIYDFARGIEKAIHGIGTEKGDSHAR